jgi:hypothetical protein
VLYIVGISHFATHIHTSHLTYFCGYVFVCVFSFFTEFLCLFLSQFSSFTPLSHTLSLFLPLPLPLPTHILACLFISSPLFPLAVAVQGACKSVSSPFCASVDWESPSATVDAVAGSHKELQAEMIYVNFPGSRVCKA